ncbi:aminotransferase class IV [Isosphaeraceae bacterium EP7]
MPVMACLNGELMPADQARVPISDRGFLFGDAIYEVCRVYRGRCWLEDSHMDRLARSLREMQFPPIDLVGVRRRMHATIEASDVAEGTVYIQITRGVAPRAHAFPNPPVPPTEVIVARPYDDSATALMRETGCRVISHADIRWGRCDVKSVNLLGNVLANEAAHRAGAFEAVLIDRDGLITEATHSSLCWVKDGVIIGTPDGPEILPGTTRHRSAGLAERLGFAFADGRITLEDLKRADEVILTGTTIEVLSVVTIDDATIGDGTPGPVTRKLQSAFTEAVRRWLAGDEG